MAPVFMRVPKVFVILSIILSIKRIEILTAQKPSNKLNQCQAIYSRLINMSRKMSRLAGCPAFSGATDPLQRGGSFCPGDSGQVQAAFNGL